MIERSNRENIIEKACVLWNGFLEYSREVFPTAFTSWSLFEVDAQTTFGHNRCAVEFFRFCASVNGISDAQVLNYKLAGVKPGRDGVAPSWLWNMQGADLGDRALITIDRPAVLARPFPNIHRVYTYLILHETGHLVLHWSYLNSASKHTTQEGALAFDSKPTQEEEAWWFCFAVAGCATGAIALDARKGNPESHCPVWYNL